METGMTFKGKPYAGNSHAWFGKRKTALAAMPERRLLLDTARILASIAVGFAAVTLVAVEPTYVNDFTTRNSSKPLPEYGVWRTANPYPDTSTYLTYLVNGSHISFDPTNLSDYYGNSIYKSDYTGQGRPAIDGWFIPYFKNTSSAPQHKLDPRYVVPEDSEGLAGTPFFTFTMSSARYGYVLQPFHNEFTNGQLRMQIDLKTPVRWADEGAYWFKVFPVYRKYMEIMAWNNSQNDTLVSPGKFGMRGNTSANKNYDRTYPQYWDSRNLYNGTTQCGNNYSGGYNYWFRYIVTYDLDAKTFFGDIYRMDPVLDGGSPTFDTALPDKPYVSFGHAGDARTVEGFMTDPSDDTGGLAGFALSAYGPYIYSNAEPAMTNKVFADNIRLSWKASTSEDFEVFYENDFTTRRYRTICAPVQTAEAAYAAPVETEDVTYTSSPYTYVTDLSDGYSIVPACVTGDQATGCDGWRRLASAARNNGAVGVIRNTVKTFEVNDRTSTAPFLMLSFANQGCEGRLVQTLAQSFSSGTVRIVGDVRLPWMSANITTAFRRCAGIGLGSSALYDASLADVTANIAGGVGYERLSETGPGLSRPYTIAEGGADGDPVHALPETYTAVGSNAWYRLSVTANLDTRKYAVEVTEIGTTGIVAETTAPGPVVFSATDLDFAADVSDIGSLYLRGYGYGGAASDGAHYNMRTQWDNLCVWHNDDLIYENDFYHRTRTVKGLRCIGREAAAAQFNSDHGQDDWVRRDFFGPDAFDVRATVRDDNGNQYLSLGRAPLAGAGHMILVSNTLGEPQVQPFRFHIDIRPPATWTATNGCVTVALGDRSMMQTEALESVYGAHRQMTFGLVGPGAPFSSAFASELCPYYRVGCNLAAGGETIKQSVDPTHWYRFCVRADPVAGMYSVRVFDLGATHRDMVGGDGTLIATTTDMPFENALGAGEGISSLYIHAQGLGGALIPENLDPGHALIDNIKVEGLSGGTVVFR